MDKKKNRAVFIDRDGTIIEDRGYLNDPEGVEFIEGSIPALKMLAQNGFKLVLVTNQSGISRNLVTHEQLNAIHDKLAGVLSLNGIRFDAMEYCPHGPEEDCLCRKPNIGMALSASKKADIDLCVSYCVGDKMSDVGLGKKFGGKGVLVLTGSGKNEKTGEAMPDYTAKNLYEAAKWIITDAAQKQRQKPA
ncbi:MAG: hypothetical protein A2297_00260 [Elusimicrobia bacterium RIFOXYB2_FULL_48_7]|nr:MAG: hypothetical protein A2297_00260 [Elusimicrobia bacterium RIFOXYB2_FULL_48_7]